MEFEPHDRFLRDLNPAHLKVTEEGYELSSAAFKHKRVNTGLFACSVDSERLAGSDAEGARTRRGHKEWGVGRVSLEDVRSIGQGDVVHSPEPDNEAHCTLTVRRAKAKKLAGVCEIVTAPSSPDWVQEFGTA